MDYFKIQEHQCCNRCKNTIKIRKEVKLYKKKLKTLKKRVCKYYKLSKLDNLPKRKYRRK